MGRAYSQFFVWVGFDLVELVERSVTFLSQWTLPWDKFVVGDGTKFRRVERKTMPPITEQGVFVLLFVLAVLMTCCLCVWFCFERVPRIVPYLRGYGYVNDDDL